jgi:hypothetical protein
VKLWSAVLSLALILNAGRAAAASEDTTDADTKEVLSYRLTLSVLEKMVAAHRALALELAKDIQYQVRTKLEKELRALENMDEPSVADFARIEKLQEQIEEVEDRLSPPSLSGGDESLSAMEKRIQSFSPLVSALQKSALSPREYAKFMLVFVQASLAGALQKKGGKLPKDVLEENVAFVREHKAQLEAMARELEGAPEED